MHMNRRNFLMALGLVAAEVVCVRQTKALGNLNAFAPATTRSRRYVNLKKLDGHLTRDVLTRKRFISYIDQYYAGVTAPFFDNRPILDAARLWMGSGEAKVVNNRYFVAHGTTHRVAQNRGMLWIDTHPAEGLEKPLGILAFLTIGQGTSRTLWIVPNQPISTLSKHDLPRSLPAEIAEWLGSVRVKRDGGAIDKVVVYQPDSSGVTSSLNLRHLGVKARRTRRNVVATSLSSVS
jgi:hypothetical protein